MVLAMILNTVRQHRTTLLLALLAAVSLEVVVPMLVYSSERSSPQGKFGYSPLRAALDQARSCSILALVGLPIVTGVLGGALQATERRERWSEYAAMLPMSRGRRAMIRLGVSFVLALVLWAVQAEIFMAIAWWEASERMAGVKDPYQLMHVWTREEPQRMAILGGSAAMALAMFGLCALSGTIARRPTVWISAIGLALVAGFVYAEAHRPEMVTPGMFPRLRPESYLTGIAIVGLLSIPLAWLISAKRVAP